MPERTQIIDGNERQWILHSPLNRGEVKDVWSAYDFTQYLERAGLRREKITINPETRQRFLQECQLILGAPPYAVRFLVRPAQIALKKVSEEVETLAKLDDPRIVATRDFNLKVSHGADYNPFYVMDKLEGNLLRTKVEVQEEYRGDIQGSIRLIKDIAGALGTAHDAGIVHRELKPKSVFVRHDGSPVLIDWSVSHFVKGEHHSLLGEKATAPEFIPPELRAAPVDQRNVRPANDIYALGKLLYYMISAGKKLPGEAHRQAQHDLRREDPSREMEQAYRLFNSTICDIGERLQTVDEFLTFINRELIEGSICTFCGKGAYRPVEGETMKVGKQEARLFVCDKCGNTQWFVHA